ncbi:MAG TPA: magnesium transporter CorA family protein [Vicinamibacterales bacterium]|nr:magnesium transporter CorA family protein [Vicinamibacterales bacterium]
MIRYFVHRGGRTEQVDRFEPAWLLNESGVIVWADIAEPTEQDAAVLREVFGLHELPVEAAVQRETNPKVESYGRYLYIVLHGINFQAAEHRFETHETDFFLAPNFLVTLHDGQRRSIAHISELCARADHILAEGPVALLHRIVDTMVDHYRPEVDELEERLDEIEKQVIESPSDELTADILAIKRDITTLRRIVIPQRDVVGRLGRREFDLISQEMAYRFRDVYDQFARMADDSIVFQDRVTGVLDAHLASVSNRLANVSRLLAVIAALFGPMTVITGLFGMNVPLPTLIGSVEYQFWEIIGIMVVSSSALFYWFKKSGWW